MDGKNIVIARRPNCLLVKFTLELKRLQLHKDGCRMNCAGKCLTVSVALDAKLLNSFLLELATFFFWLDLGSVTL